MEADRRHGDTGWHRAAASVLCVVVAALNLYIVRDLFVVETTAQMHSMHGFWTALARLGGESWFAPAWWPFWDGGMPFEYAYAPLIPGAAALTSVVLGVSELRAVQMVLGAILVVGPPLLLVGTWRLTGAVWWSFVAAVSYSLLAPDTFLAPTQGYRFDNILDLHRYYVVTIWDEGPHMAALALWPLATLSLFRLLETRRWSWLAGGVLVMAAMVYASAFGATLLALTAICVLGALGFRLDRMALVALAGVLTYLTACAALPLSLIQIIRNASNYHGHGWTWGSWTTLALVGVAWSVAQPWLLRRVADSRLRFFALFALTTLLMVWLYKFGGRQFVPQPERYKMELAVGVTLAAIFTLRLHWSKLSRPLAGALALLALAVAVEQTVTAGRWGRKNIEEREIAQTIESRLARAVEAHVPPGERVMLSGSMARWLNAFSDRVQFGGGSWSTAPNLAQQEARNQVFLEVADIRRSVSWFHAFGVAAVAVAGPDSPAQWKTFADPDKYEGHFQPLWSEDDTTLYRVPLRTTSQAHALAEGAQTTRDWTTFMPFVEKLQNERLPGLTLRWEGRNRVLIEGRVLADEGVLAHINYHPGWTAQVGGQEVPLEAEGLGQIWIRPGCDGDCSIELEYGGGFELWAVRWVSLLAGLSMAALLWRGRGGHTIDF